MGVTYQAMGNQQKAREHFQRFRQEMEKLWKKGPKDADTAFALATAAARLGDEQNAWSLARKGVVLDPAKHFEYAQVLSLLHRRPEAIEQLRTAFNSGFRNYIFAKIHPDFQPLHGEPEFEKLLADAIKT